MSASPALPAPPPAEATFVGGAGFQPIHEAVLRWANRPGLDLFVSSARGGPPVLLRDGALELTGDRLAKLHGTVDRELLVRKSDFQEISRELLENLDDIAGDARLPEADRFALVQTAAAAEIEFASTLVNPERLISSSALLGGSMATLMQAGGVHARAMFEVARHDSYTFAHVTNVCCYALILAEEAGFNGNAELEQIAIGAMLHDIGKRKIPVSILRKPGALTADERATIQQHALWGYEELAFREDLTLPQKLMAYQHHERVDGRGYPVGLTGGDMHPWARMLAVVDVFDALTGRRPYRNPMTPQDAMGYLKQNSRSHFDEEMVRCWIRALSRT